MPNLSPMALIILKEAYKHYASDNAKDFYCFDNLEQFKLSERELAEYCKELHDARLVFFEHDKDGTPYLYMLFNGVQYIEENL